MLQRTPIVLMSLILLVVPIALVSAQETPPDVPRQAQGERPNPRDFLIDDLITILSEATGLSPRDFASVLRDGGTIADVLEANGADVETATADVTAVLLDRVGESEANGRISAERAADLRESLPERVETTINDTPRPRVPRPEDRLMGVLAASISEATRLDLRTIALEIRDGATLADVLAENDLDIDIVTADVMTVLNERLAEAVANGNMTEDQAATLRSEAEARLTEWLNGEAPFPRPVRDRLQDALANLENAVFGVFAQTLTDETSLTMREIAMQIRDGATVSDILSETGADTASITRATLEQLTNRLEVSINNGTLTQDQADTLLQAAETRIDAWLTGEVAFPRRPHR